MDVEAVTLGARSGDDGGFIARLRAWGWQVRQVRLDGLPDLPSLCEAVESCFEAGHPNAKDTREPASSIPDLLLVDGESEWASRAVACARTRWGPGVLAILVVQDPVASMQSAIEGGFDDTWDGADPSKREEWERLVEMGRRMGGLAGFQGMSSALSSLHPDLLRLALDVVPLAVSVYGPDRRFVYANATFCRVTRTLRARILGRTDAEAFLPQSVEHYGMTLAEAFEAGQSRSIELRRSTLHGERDYLVHFTPFVREDGEVAFVIRTGTDITELKHAQAEARAGEAWFHALAESLPLIVWTTDPDGRVLYMNPRWEEYSGIPSTKAVGDGWKGIVHPQDLGPTLQRWGRSLAEGIPYEMEHRYRGRDGAYRWYLCRAVPIRDEVGRIVTWFGSSTDIEFRKHAEEELSYSKGQLEDVVASRTRELEMQAGELRTRNAELQRFAHVASHDLQEPLRTVVSYAQLLAKRYQGNLDSVADDYIVFIVTAARRMGELIDDLLAYSHAIVELPERKPVDMAWCARSAIESLRSELEANGAEVLVGELPPVVGDGMALRRLFRQLVGNSLKFRRKDGVPRIEISARRQGMAWEFSVRDNGIGIDEVYREKIFDAFARLHRWQDYPGSGIGLAICRRIVESHGGRIWVDAAEGGGARFHFTLPAPVDLEDPELDVAKGDVGGS